MELNEWNKDTIYALSSYVYFVNIEQFEIGYIKSLNEE